MNDDRQHTDNGVTKASAHERQSGEDPARDTARAEDPCSAEAGFGAEQAAGDRAGESGNKDASAMPKPTFSTFVLSLASSTLVQLGEVPDPATGKIREDLPLAKHGIDVLCMLQDKTANGLDQEESRLLEGLLYELRMKYVVKK